MTTRIEFGCGVYNLTPEQLTVWSAVPIQYDVLDTVLVRRALLVEWGLDSAYKPRWANARQ